ncbi:protein roadkill-like [Planococcus citri]|uniref:protein roadkill-like n=1 Tax=Planococcus citri TaxID=170843 RepID=UPI0031F724E5
MSVSNMRKNDHHNIPVLGPNGTIVENWSSISPKIAKVNYVWIINYYSFYHKNGEQLRSPIFTATANNRCMWFLQLCFGNDEFIGIDIILDRASECNKVFAKFTVSILDNERKQLVTKYSQTCEFDGIRGDYWGFKKFVCKSHLSDLDKFAPDDKLTIYCEITFSELEDLVENSDQIDSAWFQPKVPVNDLSEDLKRFYTSQHLTDVVISVKGKCFPAHKVILAARSSVFSAMFTHDTKENQSNRVDITDIDENIVEEMLYYMYTGNIHDLDNSAEG